MPTTAEDILERSFWGWQEQFGEAACLRLPLPPTEDHPVVVRTDGTIDGVSEFPAPPYLAAAVSPGDGHVDFDLYEGSGWRAGFDRENRDDSDCVYADSDDLPEEWRETVERGIEMVRERWPDQEIRFRPRRSDKDPDS